MSTLTDTLRELSELLPERFRYDEIQAPTGGAVEIASTFFDGVWWDVVNGPTETYRVILLSACLEECRERGWEVKIHQFHDGSAHVRIPGRVLAGRDTPAEAISTALLEAIKNEAEK